MGAGRTFDVLVIGAGIVGLCTAWALLERGVARVGVLERVAPAHPGGSSHSHARITRSTYVDADWIRLMDVAHGQAWPALERTAGARLIHPRTGLFWGAEGGLVEKYFAAVKAAGARVERIDLAQASARFPAFRFLPGDLVLRDDSAGVVDAAGTMAALVGHVGARLHTGVTVLGLEPGEGEVAVHTDAGRFTAGHVVVTAGAWTGGLLPGLAPRLHPARQTVGYFPVRHGADALPPWAWFGADESEMFYGLPAFGRPEAKAAQHVTRGRDDDPDATPAVYPVGGLASVAAFLAAHTRLEVVGPPAAEHCLYTNTTDEVFVLDRMPGSPRVTVGAGFSGHGFKFGPLVGRILAGLCLDDESGVPAFEAQRARFRVAARG